MRARACVPRNEGNMSAASKSRRIKLVFGIVIPVLVLVTTIVMVSISFAWFSRETEASIQSINLSTQKAFVLDFSSTGTTEGNLPYRGQRAIDKDQQLVNPFTIDAGDEYIMDAPYFFISPIQISTGSQTVDLHLELDGVEISKGDTILDSYNGNGSETTVKHNSANIPLAFTWFFKAHPVAESPEESEDAPPFNPTLNCDVEESGAKHMKQIAPAAGDVWYTPYGKMEFGTVDGKVQPTQINGAAYQTSSFSIANVQSTVDIKEFTAADGTYFDFYIIFAPEKLFWSHILSGSYNAKVTDLYDLPAEPEETRSEIERREIYGKFFDEGKTQPSKYAMYYSDQNTYQGSHFKFGAVLNVSSKVESALGNP